MQNKSLDKIIIIGDACRGKTTLAHKISSIFDAPHYSTDDCLYEIKFTKPRDKQEGIDIIENVYRSEKWIVEGTTRYLLEPGLDVADMIIHLEHKNVLIQWTNLLKRYFQRNYDGENIKSLLRLMRHVLYKRYGWGYRKGQKKISEAINPHKHKVISLKSFKEIDDFVKTLNEKSPQGVNKV